jgi:hypothetical protein
LREGYRQRVFKNVALRNLFAPETENIGGDWRKQLKEELYYLYPS